MRLDNNSKNDFSLIFAADCPPRAFPEDIQTFFESQDSGIYTDTDDIIFVDLTSIASPIFHCELNA